MSRLELRALDLQSGLEDIAATSRARLGFVANSARSMAHRPEITRAFMQLAMAIHGKSATLPPDLRNMISQVSTHAADSRYGMAHSAHNAAVVGVTPEKQRDLRQFETSPHFSTAERAALRVAERAARIPNAVTDDDFAALKAHYSDAQIVELVAAIGMSGFLSRWNDTLATELEPVPMESAMKNLAPQGWSAGRHAPRTAASD